MYTLQNDFITFTLDDHARLICLENRAAGQGNIISRPQPLFRAVMQNGENWEDVAYAKDMPLVIDVSGNVLTLTAEKLNTRMGSQEIRLTVTVCLEDEKLRFGAKIENRSGVTVNDFLYPCIGAVRSLGDGSPGLLFPQYYGQYHTDITHELASFQTRYIQSELTKPYPWPLSMQWMALTDRENCLYCAGHDALFHATSLRAIGSVHEDVTLEMDKMAFVAPGETWESPEYVLWLYRGSWQRGAEEYRNWADTWRRPVEPEPWIRDMNGYFLVINKQQYGDELWPYDTIPRLYELALENGCDTVGMFAWFQSGHDNRYPDLEVSETMGGEQALRDGIRAVQEKGGHVTLYYQGHLIDVGTEFYKNVGHRIEGKSRWGTPYYEEYSKYHESDFLRFFSKKLFSTVCPWCGEWHDLMAQRAEWIHGLGADGILYDQIGGINPYPCFDSSHGHKKPSLSYTQGRLKLLPAIRKAVDRHPGYAFMTETITDIYSQFIDCIHGIGSEPGAKAERWQETVEPAPRVVAMPEMFRHTFPETLSTIRNGRPYISPRFANYALCYGFRFEMELRYLRDKREIEENIRPEWREYSRRICSLRRKYADMLLNGAYRCDPALSRKNPALMHGVFENGEKRAVVFWNDSEETLPLRLCSQAFSRWVSPEAEGSGIPETIAPQSVLVLLNDAVK